jgi:hypothetical protein
MLFIYKENVENAANIALKRMENPSLADKPKWRRCWDMGKNLVGETHCSRKNQPTVAARIREGESEKTKPPNQRHY